MAIIFHSVSQVIKAECQQTRNGACDLSITEADYFVPETVCLSYVLLQIMHANLVQ